MGIKRIVDTAFWTDGKVEEFTPEDKYFMLYLLTNPHTTQLGIYEMSMKRTAYEMGYSVDSIRALVERFENTHGIIIYSKSTNEIAIKNFLRHSVIKGGKPVEDCIVAEMAKVKDKSLISKVFRYLSTKDGLNATVQKIINEYEFENDNEIENENENENDVSLVRYADDTLAYREKSSKSKPIKHKYGEYKNVLLSDNELEKLKDEYIDWQDRIERLSSYVASTGKSYKSHYATIRNWARKDQTQPVKRGNNQTQIGTPTAYEYDAVRRRLARSNLENAVVDNWESKKAEQQKTVGNDEEIRARANALRNKLNGGDNG